MNILLAIPTSILGTFIVIYFLGFTLNTYTVLGLTLVVGIVVDDAIMVLENIYRHREMGEGKVKAASVGAREITFAAAATTLAIVAIFLPVAFLKGIIGKFFFQFGVTISVAVLISLLEALTLAPMRCSQFLEIEHRGRLGRTVDGLFSRLSALYLRALGPVLRHRGRVLLGAFAFFLLSLGTVFLLRQEFIPSQDMSRFTIRFQTPVGTSLDATDRYFRQIEKFVMSRPEVTLFAGNVGGGSDVNSGQAYVNMKEPRERPIDPELGRRLTQLEFMDVVRRYAATIPGGRIVLQDISQTGFSPSRGGGFPIEFNIRGRDWNVLAASSRQIAEQMRRVGPRHRRRHRLPGGHAGGPGRPRPGPGRGPRGEHVRHRRDRERGHRRRADRQVQGQGAALRHPRPPPRHAAGAGPRTSRASSSGPETARSCGSGS